MTRHAHRTAGATPVSTVFVVLMALFAWFVLPVAEQALPGAGERGVAYAQDGGKQPPFNVQHGMVPEPEPPKVDKKALSDRAMNKEQGRSAALIFWLFAFAVITGAIFVITRRNLVTAVMGMVGTFFAIAAVYAMLYARFLTAMQVLVYAGAIMVLFVFVIMILNKPEAEPWNRGNLVGKVVILGVMGYLLVRMIMVLWGVEAPDVASKAPAEVVLQSGESVPFGSTKAIGHALFRDYLFPFEAVSIVLLIAVVGAVAVARPHERRPGALSADVAAGAAGAASTPAANGAES